VNALDDAAPRVLLFPGRNERVGIGTLDSDKNREEIGFPQELEQLVIVCDIERCLRRKFERIAARVEPPGQLRQKLLQCLLVADEIVIDELDDAAPSDAVEYVQLGQHLIIGLGPRNASVELDDVAEFASKRTAAGELNTYGEVVFELEQIESRNRALPDVNLKFGGLEYAVFRSVLDRRDEVPPPTATGIPRA
jgi:hypothetical protein